MCCEVYKEHFPDSTIDEESVKKWFAATDSDKNARLTKDEFGDFMSYIFLNQKFDEGTALVKRIKEEDDEGTEALDAFT